MEWGCRGAKEAVRVQNRDGGKCLLQGGLLGVEILAHLVLLCLEDSFYKVNASGNPAWSKSMGPIFPMAFAQSVSQFSNSQESSDFLIIIIFVMVLCDQ